MKWFFIHLPPLINPGGFIIILEKNICNLKTEYGHS
jgi:hypothetical protein